MAEEGVPTADAALLARDWKIPDRGTAGMIMLILTETVLFGMFVAASLVYRRGAFVSFPGTGIMLIRCGWWFSSRFM
jgi:heme/copper-type cytochrome/quinol oxidase subunit 3